MTLSGRLMLANGHDIEWGWDGFMVVWANGTQTLPLPGRGDVPQIEAALIGWHAGEIEGRHRGRATLQNDFRNLMDCQK
jgi:hypothetical protein